jgi:hypothetical protein
MPRMQIQEASANASFLLVNADVWNYELPLIHQHNKQLTDFQNYRILENLKVY